ncbi:MAG: disulfide oxidoreductase [Candidatus Staskawiczbacteria bacterium]|nr:disulfide oxidoreductase [Candidatus Staskawiczbacteria bacterium]
MAKITKTTTLEKILEKKSADEILEKNGVPCLSCPMMQFEIDKLKIGDVCKMYGLNLEKILKELNK